ncbi:ABC transporter ATP-binding protein [Kitasatospora sp. NPDC056184]|uniref:ABC transporter ATP-binding protein n=1 Tax=Kitasatospora sp. NPDC056184 TaxID=3345738 RepID=UPI0035DD1E94
MGGRSLFNGVELEVTRNESVAVSGASGSGKSTLLMCVLGLIRPDAGRVEVEGADLARLRGRALARYRSHHIGMVFQTGELLPELSPLENVALAALLGGRQREEAYRRAAHLLEELGVPNNDTRTAALSGGERQRTAVARALVNEPALLVADEPTAALDPDNRDSVCDLIFSLPKSRGCALVVVTHDKAVAAYADRQLVLDTGQLTNPDRSGGGE